MQENIWLNKVDNNITLIHDDIANLPSVLINYDFDRAIVPTPYGMDYILANISEFVKNGGFIHFYTFKPEFEIPELIEKIRKLGLKIDYYRRCGNVAPGISRWGFDLKKQIE